MKKPRKPKAKHALSKGRLAAPPAARASKRDLGAAALSFLAQDRLPKPGSKAVSPAIHLGIASDPFARSAAARRSVRASQVARISDKLDQREIITLLVLPFLLLAFVLAMSQSWRHSVRPASIATTPSLVPGRAAPSPVTTGPTLSPHVVASPDTMHMPHLGLAEPALRLPAGPPSIALSDVQIPAPPLQLPPQAPSIAPFEVALASPVPVLAMQAPEIEMPEVQLGSPALALPSGLPAIEIPDVQLGIPVFSLPTGLPAIEQPEIKIAVPQVRLPSEPPQSEPPEGRPMVAIIGPTGPAEMTPAPGPNVCLAKADFGLTSYDVRSVAPGENFGERLAEAALRQTTEMVIYNDKYRRIGFPMGDVPAFYGVCTDVVIRAYRALGVDLQEQVHRARIGAGDTSIAHRRTETLRRFFASRGASLPISGFPEAFQPGDIVTYYRPQNRHSRSHIAIVSNLIGPTGRPMIIHNRGWGPQLEDALFVDQITGHYRFTPAPLAGQIQQVATKPARAGTLASPARPVHRTALTHVKLRPPAQANRSALGGTALLRAQ